MQNVDVNENLPRKKPADLLKILIQTKEAVCAVIGLGYVGLPLLVACASAGFKSIGFDVDENKHTLIRDGRSYIGAVSDERLGELAKCGLLDSTMDFRRLKDADVVVICVPTPLTKQREPDLSFLRSTAETIAKNMRRSQLVVLESTSWPGTTTEVLQPILETSGYLAGVDFFLGFSPEREDPGNDQFTTTSIPKVVAGDGMDAHALALAFYRAIFDEIVPVSSTSTAEAVKILENVFRSVNIALVNELKIIFDAMNIDIWEIIDAAATKPFGYMPFYPGPGLGGHCIPIDPFYLSWKAREFGQSARFIELAGEINVNMPSHIVNRLDAQLDLRQGVSLGSARILVLGLAYKKNVADIRESPALKILKLLNERGTEVAYHDPFVPTIPRTREYPEFEGRESVALGPENLREFHAVLIITDHSKVDYMELVENSRLIIDTRNVCARNRILSPKIVKA